ncbi:MAG: argininosuccinate lyase [Patescibacteria group bacterium]
MKKLWQKNKAELHPLIEAYTVGSDYLLDQELMPYDIEASIAHALGLARMGALSKKETGRLVKGLKDIQRDWRAGKIRIPVSSEDCHTVIENKLIKKLGDLGQKIHTGRSRNDQVLVAMRLFMKDKAGQINRLIASLAQMLLKEAQRYQDMPLPGYSHTQQAMLSSVGHYYASFLESLLDDYDFLRKVKDQIDQNPLGSAAGFGVNLSLDRNYTSRLLHFKKTQLNSLYCQNSKGKFESLFLEALAQIMMTAAKLADDMIVFTTKEFSFFKVNGLITTGSSIMPQKENLDVLEIIRGNASVVIANQALVKDLNRNTFSGYNRDTQLIKKPLLESVKIVSDTLAVLKIFLETVAPDRGRILKSIRSDILLADTALELTKESGLPWRQAYREARDVNAGQKLDYTAKIKEKISLGAAGHLDLPSYQIRIKNLKNG